MCGRYVLNAPEDLGASQLRQLDFLPLPWNAAPTNEMPVIVENADGDHEARSMKA